MTKPASKEAGFAQYPDVASLMFAAVADADTMDEEASRELLSRGHRLAQRNEVDSIVAHAAMRSLGPENVPAPWKSAHDRVESRTGAYMAELDRLAALLATEGITVVALKNAGIARAVYRCPGCCPMGDLDLLVDKQHFPRAHEILLADGYSFEFRSPLEKNELGAAERSGGGEYRKALANGQELWVEVQWRPIAGRWIRPDQEPNAAALIARSRKIPGSDARILAPEDNLLQVSVHTAKHTYVRAPGFRLHTDVDRIVRRQPIDWDGFVELVRSLQVRTAVYFSLAIPHEMFGSPVPESVVERLRPGKWKTRLMSAWLRRVGLLNPDEKKFGPLGYMCFTALLYDDLPGFLRALVPDPAWMKERYGFTNSLLLPLYYVRRGFDLAFRRVP